MTDTAVSTPGQTDTSARAAHSSDHETMRRFLLVGCERSGSTMFRLMLDHHPDLSCMYESDFMVVPYDRCRNRPLSAFASGIRDDWHFRHSGLTFPENADCYEDAIHGFFRQRMKASGKRIVGATVQHGFHHLPELFPDARYIHLLRDGRPVAASMINMGWVGNTYYGARRWKETVQQVLTLQRQIDPHNWLTLRYEDLLTEPQAQLSRVCDFLGVPFDPAMLAFHEDSTYDPLDPSNAIRWKKRMSAREILEAEMACGSTLNQVGYAAHFPRIQPTFVERWFLSAAHRLSRLQFNCHRYGLYLVLSRKLCALLRIRKESIRARFDLIHEHHIK